MAAPLKSDEHLPRTEEKKSRIWLPGMQTPKDVAKKLLIPAKRLLVPQGRGVDPDEAVTADAPGEQPLAVRYNHQQRRRVLKIGGQLRRRQIRAKVRKARRLDLALYEASSSSHQYDPTTGRLRRFDSQGKLLTTIALPPGIDIRSRTGYFEVNGPKELRKSEAQVKLEKDGAPKAVFVEGKQPRRQKGSWAPPKPKAKPEAVEAA